MGLLQKGFSAGKKGLKSLDDARKVKKAAKDAKKAAKTAEKAGGQALKEEAKQAKLARKGQKKIDRKTYGGGKKGRAAKAADIAGKAAARKMEDVGMGDAAEAAGDAGMDGASMANPMRKKPRLKKPVSRKPKIKRAKNGVAETKNITPPSTSSNSKKDSYKSPDGLTREQAKRRKKMGPSMMEGAKKRNRKGANSEYGVSMSGENYNAKQAYNKDLSASARLHYLENNRADKKAKGGSHRSPIMKHMKNI